MEEGTESKGFTPPELVKWAGYVALILAVGATATSVFADKTGFAIVGNAVLVLYLISAYFLGRGNAQVMSRMGENGYFIGYVVTITGLSLLAWQIGDHPYLLDKDNIKDVLTRGGSAVLSTVIGLIGMNLLKGQAQSLEQEKEQEVDVVERILSRFAERLEQSQVSQGQELIKIFSASQLSQNLNTEITALTAVIKSLHEDLSAGSTQTKQFVNASKQHHEEIVKTMETLQKRMQTLTPLTGAVDEFLKTANMVASTLKTIGQNFGEVDSLNLNLAKLVATTGQLNTELTTGKTGMGHLNTEMTTGEARLLSINTKSAEMGLAIDHLVAELNHQVHTLTSLTEPFNEFADLSNRISPMLNQTDANVAHLAKFTGSIAALQKSVEKLKDSFEANKKEMEGISTAAANFMSVMGKRPPPRS